MVQILYQDKALTVCVKPPRVLSTDEPGGMPELVRQTLGTPNGDVRTVHRLDRVVGGVMVLARTADAASRLSAQIREGPFQKRYLAMVHGVPENPQGTFRDLLVRDKARKMTFVTQTPGKDAKEAILDYRVLWSDGGVSLVDITLRTGRTHQIRVQFASRDMVLLGERKYGTRNDPCELALWSWQAGFTHPDTGEKLTFSCIPPEAYPWTLCQSALNNLAQGDKSHESL